MRTFALVLFLAGGSLAPLQCAGEPDPELRMEDEPGEELYRLAQRFRQQGDRQAWKQTLLFLLERHDGSRFAASARMDLEEAGEVVPP